MSGLRVPLGLAMILLAGCMQVVRHEMPWSSSRQLVLVRVADWNSDHGQLQTFMREPGGPWKAEGPTQPVVIGRAGAAWGDGLVAAPGHGPHKHEGDGRAPAGVFRIGEAFGYADHAITAMDYRAMQVDDYCIDVPGSPLYNQIVDTRHAAPITVAGSTEPMRRDLHVDGDQRYRLGFVIEQNPGRRAGAGSCIFAHIWTSAKTPTAGCTAMDGAAMERLLAWLKPEDQPVFVLLPEDQFMRLRKTWRLPALP